MRAILAELGGLVRCRYPLTDLQDKAPFGALAPLRHHVLIQVNGTMSVAEHLQPT
jgi:hypothetical protein